MSEMANRSEGTKLKYQQVLKDFTEWLGETPDQILKQRKLDLKADDPRDQRRYEIKLKAFVSFLQEKGYAISSVQVAYAAIRSFFETNFMPLQMRKGDYPTGESLGHRAATKDEIKKLCEKISLRTKTLIFFLKDSGLRIGDVSRLKYGDISKQLESGESYIQINLITRKNKTVAKTFIGPETVQLLKKYMEQRKKGTRNVKVEEISHDSPLFRQRETFGAISRSGLSSLLGHHIIRIGLEKEISAHSFRKFFQTQLEAGGVHPNWVQQMMGHKLSGVEGSYSRPTEQQLRDVYVRAYNFLRINPVLVTSEEIKSLETRLEESRQRTDALVHENEQLKQVITELQNRTEQLIAFSGLSDEVKNMDKLAEKVAKLIQKKKKNQGIK